MGRFNRLRKKPPLNSIYQIASHGNNTTPLLSGREKTFSRFLFYRLFYANIKPTILCEGKTDNIYLKSAISILAEHYPKLANRKTEKNPYELLIQFVEYSTGTTIHLEPWQVFILTTVFGWVKPDGKRRFRLCLIEVPRGNGKTLAADTLIATTSGFNLKNAVEATQVEHKPYGQWISKVSKTPPNR